jgi:hypothetical protein
MLIILPKRFIIFSPEIAVLTISQPANPNYSDFRTLFLRMFGRLLRFPALSSGRRNTA